MKIYTENGRLLQRSAMQCKKAKNTSNSIPNKRSSFTTDHSLDLFGLWPV